MMTSFLRAPTGSNVRRCFILALNQCSNQKVFLKMKIIYCAILILSFSCLLKAQSQFLSLELQIPKSEYLRSELIIANVYLQNFYVDTIKNLQVARALIDEYPTTNHALIGLGTILSTIAPRKN